MHKFFALLLATSFNSIQEVQMAFMQKFSTKFLHFDLYRVVWALNFILAERLVSNLLFITIF